MTGIGGGCATKSARHLNERFLASRRGFHKAPIGTLPAICIAPVARANEIRTQFKVAVERGDITQSEANDRSAMYEEIAKMLTGLIAHFEERGPQKQAVACTQLPNDCPLPD